MQASFHKDGTLPTDGQIFVFGSNLAGRHGKGAALVAVRYGAVYGVGEGLRGKTFAIPTKDESMRPRTLSQIEQSIKKFKKFAKENPNKKWFVTRVGCGLAGFSDSQIAPMFKNVPNCSFPQEWKIYIA